ncbi:MAG: SPOR domain-containing protein [Gammaproteobacteria bacterium]|nr:SPOR domain-containing protein [Gammaproteobacteria bacterium]
MSEDQLQTDPTLLTEEELNKLGLREHPFTEHADDTYLYSDSQLEMTSNIIMEYLNSPATTIVLTGEDGVGKTTFLRKVLRLGYQQYQFCTLRVNEDTDFEFIENKIKQRWVLPENSGLSSVADLSIENYVITYLREHTHAVLIIDDAHFLDSSTLDRLFTLKHRIGLACPLSLGFILAGENTLKLAITDLEDSNPACTQVYQINVRPFTREQTGQYIEHRLKTAGLENEVLLDEPKITEIYKSTLGNIRQIHEVAVLALQNQCREDSLGNVLDPHITIRNPKPKVPVFLISILAIIGVGFYFNNYFSNKELDDDIIPLQKPLTNEPTLSPIMQGSNIDPAEQTPSLPLPNAPTAPSDKLDVSAIKIPQIAKKEPAVIEDSLLAESIEDLDIKQLETLKEKLTEKNQTSVTENSTPNNSPKIAEKSDPVEKSPTPPTQVAVAKKGENWLKALDPESYTLQVVATKDTKQLESLIKKENLKENYAYFDKPVKDATYYVLVVGNYKTRNDALTAIEKLPSNLRKNKPWPVALKNIQKFLN